MAFGRKKSSDDEPEAPVVEEAAKLPPAPVVVTTGPYDLADLPEDDEQGRLDLGGIRVGAAPDTEIRVDVSPEGHVVSAIVVHKAGHLQLNAFAAPRREGIWNDVRTEIAESLRADNGDPREVDGAFGRELLARIPTGEAGQTTQARFVGVDGPRWFLRGLITGPAATDPAQGRALEEAFRNTVVVRGNDAMAPRDPLPLKLPREAAEAAAAAHAEAAASGDAGEQRFAVDDEFNPFERGPEITETR
ncbi:MAG: hypothetical protein QOE45_2777 [Frankiaceae bacterium]|nr:hypothetical protein [Frankiaceae bacterium]